MAKRKTEQDNSRIVGSPVFCAKFADGTVTKMTTFHKPNSVDLDVERGIYLARCAYQARNPAKSIPQIKEAYFKQGKDTVLRKYTAEELKHG